MIQGDVSTFLSALGASEGDARLERALALVGGEPEVETFVDGGVKSKYLSMPDRGVTFLLTAGELSTVFFYAENTAEKDVYREWPALIEGVGSDSTRDDVVAALGEPLRAREAFVTYEVDAGYVQFEFNGDTIKLAVVMRELIGGLGPEPEQRAPASGDVEGELSVVMNAVGLPLFSREHRALIALAGPAMESYDDVRNGEKWLYFVFPNSGVTLQFKEEVLVAALVELVVKDGSAAYPSPDLLVFGLSLPSSREGVQAHFGKPERSSQFMDLYLVDDRYVRFDFESDVSTAVTVVQPGVEL